MEKPLLLFPFKEWVLGSNPSGRTIVRIIYNGKSNANHPAPVNMTDIAIARRSR